MVYLVHLYRSAADENFYSLYGTWNEAKMALSSLMLRYADYVDYSYYCREYGAGFGEGFSDFIGWKFEPRPGADYRYVGMVIHTRIL